MDVDVLKNLLTVVFAVSSMLAMGLTLTVKQIWAPLRRNPRRVALAIFASWVIVPAVAWLLAQFVAQSNREYAAGLILFASVAGAPFIIKLTEVAEGDIALATGLVVLLLVGTVIYLPLALPLLLPIGVPAGQVATQLSLQLLLPLGIGLFASARYPEGAATIVDITHKTSNVSLVLLLVLIVVTSIGDMIGMFGTGAVAATIAVVAVAVISGALFGGPSRAGRTTLALALGQRNMAAAFVVANASLAPYPDVFAYLAGASMLVLVVMFAFAGEIRRRGLSHQRGEEVVQEPAPAAPFSPERPAPA